MDTFVVLSCCDSGNCLEYAQKGVCSISRYRLNRKNEFPAIMAFPCCMSEEELEQRQKSKLIDKQIAKEKVYFRRKVKILLLGAGESGKSTFLKQMRIIHGSDYDVEALREFRPIIYSNILKGMKVLADARRKLKMEWGDPNNQVYGDLILNFQSSHVIDTSIFLDYVDCVKHLWEDSGIQEAYRRRNEFQLVCSPSNCVICTVSVEY